MNALLILRVDQQTLKSSVSQCGRNDNKTSWDSKDLEMPRRAIFFWEEFHMVVWCRLVS
jgi:hypothetical protein